MEIADVINYELYALDTSDESLALTKDFTYHRITPAYILIFSDKEPTGALLIKAKDYQRLTDKDTEWLGNCASTIFTQYVQEHAGQVEAARSDFVRRFSAELEVEKAKEEKK